MIQKRYFLQWLLLSLTYAAMAFFAYKLGIFHVIYQVDSTKVTSIIAIVFAVTCIYLGFGTFRADTNPVRANADVNIGRTIAYVVTLLGILGTVLGLMYQVQALGNLNIADTDAVTRFIGVVGASLSTALYATAAGIISSIGITVQTMNLEYALDVSDEDQTFA